MRIKLIFPLIALLQIVAAYSQPNTPSTNTSPTQLSAGSIISVPDAYPSTYSPPFVRSWTAFKPYTDIPTLLAASQPSDLQQTTQYYDGAGRSLQSVAKAVTPNGKDRVAMQKYDNLGRSPVQYLPYVSTENNGSFKKDPFAAQKTFLEGQYPGEQVYYSQTEYDNTPLGRVKKAMKPGNSFAGSGRGSQIAYEANGPNEVRIWTIGMYISNTPNSTAFYNENELFRTVTIDENAKRTVEYKDKEGTLILKKVEIKNDGGADIALHQNWLCTYYVYDDFNRLRAILTPKIIENQLTQISSVGNVSVATLLTAKACFLYEYDDKGRLVRRLKANGGHEYFVYDKKGRQVLGYDPKVGKWLYTKYDGLDRPIETGVFESTLSRNSHQDLADQSTDYPDLTSATYETLSQTYYDNYDWVAGSGSGLPSAFDNALVSTSWTTLPAPTTPAIAQTQDDIASSQILQDKPTGSKVKVLGSNPAKYLYTVSFYDEFGRTVQAHSTNINGGKDIATNLYGYDGKLLASKLVHNKGGANDVTYTIVTRSEFDAAGRKIRAYHKLNTNAEKLLSKNSYNEEGQLIQKDLGATSASGTGALESLKYTYYLTGALKGINEEYLSGANTSHYYGQTYWYDYGFTKQQYNGLLAGTRWRSKGDGEQRALGFSYDPADRMLKSDFTQLISSSWGNTIPSSAGGGVIDFSTQIGDGVIPTTAYDANGNILGMKQKGLKLYSSPDLDILTYSYNAADNKLLAINDIAVEGTPANAVENTLGDFKNGVSVSTEYSYDNNGNIIADLNKGISAIAYNVLDLPSQIDITGKGSLKYTYDAAGERFEKLVVPTGGGATTLYSYEGSFTYRNHVLQYIYHEEGRLRPLGSNAFAYDFFIKDHLGNIRAILTDEVKSIPYQTVKFETATIAAEAVDYDRVNYALSPRPGGFGTGGTTGTNGDQVQLLRKNTSQSVGVGKLLKVMVNDKLNAMVDYYYPSATIDNANADGNGSLLTSLGSLLANSNVLAPAIKGNGGTVTSQLSMPGGPLATFMAPQGTGVASTVPKAYLNIIFFDEQFKYVQGSYYRQIGSTFAGGPLADKSGSRQQLIESNITVPKNGYCYIYVSNQSNNLVYFDNFQVVHNPGPLLEENHYYPFGSKMTALCSRALGGPQNALGYQSKELDDEFDVDLNNFEARYYDPQIGRFLQLDPADQFASGYTGMGNNWMNGTDPDGRFWNIVIGAAIGGVMGGIREMKEGGNGLGSFFGGFVKGAIVGGVGGALAGIGQGSFLTSVIWGAGEGVVTNGLGNLMDGQPFFQGSGKAALIGGAFAAAASGVESFKNLNDGYGFGTNDGRISKFLSDKKIDKAIEFVRDRYGLDDKGWNLIYGGDKFAKSSLCGDCAGKTFAPDPGAAYPTATTVLSSESIKNASRFKNTIAHEYGHFKDIKFINGKWDFASNGQDFWNNFDGTTGYRSSFELANKMHIKASEFTSWYKDANFETISYMTHSGRHVFNRAPLNPLWYSNLVPNKLGRIIPIRSIFW